MKRVALAVLVLAAMPLAAQAPAIDSVGIVDF